MRERPFTWVVVPTYNEAATLADLAAAALAELPEPRRLLIVDDASPDGTGAIADGLAAADSEVEVLHRPRKEGIGPAYIAGFKRALESGADVIVQMDADFSHDPSDLPRLLDALHDADVVLGSR
jgi:dolichol-phosphate mannosyltransferase